MQNKPLYHYLFIRSPITKIALGIVALVISMAVLLFIGVTEETRMAAQTASWEGRGIEKGAALFANNCANCHGADGKGLPNVAPALHSKYFFTQRLSDVGWAGSLESYVELTVHAGRPSKVNSQWAQMMPTWGQRFGGPLRDDQIDSVVSYVLNWEEAALSQTDEEDPWQPFQGVDNGWAGVQATEGVTATGEITGTQGITATAGVTEMAEGVVRPPQELFVSMGCQACHNLDQPQTADSRGPVGPNMGNLPETAGSKVEGLSAEEYVHQSIVEPNAFINEGYMQGIMPPNFAEKMSEEEIQGLVTWLLNPDRAR
jgi:mono/diheme cytochrome c family protein